MATIDVRKEAEVWAKIQGAFPRDEYLSIVDILAERGRLKESHDH